MHTKPSSESSSERDQSLLRRVSWLGAFLLLAFVVICFLSPPFEYGSGSKRPTLMVTGVLMLSSVIAFFGLTTAIKISKSSRRSKRQLLLLVFAVALSTRLVALFTCPILEIDYYRYIWDGRVAIEGVSPYQFAPEEILNAPLDATGSLRNLNSLATRTESNHTILSRIHFEMHTTIYPPVSQFVFSVAMSVMPESASVASQITYMKFVMLLFDLATLWLIFCLLKLLNRHVGWLIVYAWNPLVIKEIANGGHLDSIATWLTVLSVFAFVCWWRSEIQRYNWAVTSGWAVASAVALGLGVGAKLFPVIVFPALFVVMFKKRKLTAFVFSLVFVSVVVVSLWPMFASQTDSQTAQEDGVKKVSESEPGFAESSFSGDEIEQEKVKNREGLTAFLSGWRMNDVVFAGIYMNLKESRRDANQTPWFVFTSEGFRRSFCGFLKRHGIGGENPAYSAARVATLGWFAAFYLYQLFLIGKVEGESDQSIVGILERIGWVLVVFLFLQPTVNPWYLLWAIPFCSFSNNRGWLLVSGLLLVYYSRFWFESLPGTFALGGTVYLGEGLFHHFVAWLELLAIVTVILSFLISQRWLGIGLSSEEGF